MDKVNKAKKRPNWKFWTLIAVVLALIIVLGIAFLRFDIQTWLSSILFPVVLSAAASAGVSLWFTLKTEKDQLQSQLSCEIDSEMYSIRDHYRNLWDLYKKNTKYISNAISVFTEKEFDKEFQENVVKLDIVIMEIADCALKVQKQFLQDFKMLPKAPIKDQLIFHMSPNNNLKEETSVVDFLTKNATNNGG